MGITPAEHSPAPSVVTFDDGATVKADIVVVANGVKSSLRKVVTGSDSSAAFSTNICYRGLVTQAEADRRGVDTSYWNAPSNALGKNKVCGVSSARLRESMIMT